MRSKKIKLSNFSQAVKVESECLRPDNAFELAHYKTTAPLLARGAGLSYNDSCFNQEGYLVDTQRLNHLSRFDSETGVLECQAATTFNDLLLVHPEFIPPVLPGTLHATLGGGIAHDVHGKNNPREGSLGRHIVWIDLLLNQQIIRCSRDKNTDLFFATIGGLGLTGIIINLAIRLKQAPRMVQVTTQAFDSLADLLKTMSTKGLQHDYQVAWVDLLKEEPCALLSLANYCDADVVESFKNRSIPKLPFGLVKTWNMKIINRMYFSNFQSSSEQSLQQFNNPLDSIKNWTRLYGHQGLVQFQGVFAVDNALQLINHLLELIREHGATPTLAVLKLFTQQGEGLLSFCRPGFTLAIDFIHNSQAKNAIAAMNAYLTSNDGQVYLAKDLFLSPPEFKNMYPEHQQFLEVLADYHCTPSSTLAKRIGIKE